MAGRQASVANFTTESYDGKIVYQWHDKKELDLLRAVVKLKPLKHVQRKKNSE